MKTYFLHIALTAFLIALVAENRYTQPPIHSEVMTNDSVRWKKALESFRLEEGLSIELIAAEPLVVDPVAFAFDEMSRLYVIEDRGYPDPIDGTTAPAVGRIALLTDTDQDGKYDSRTEFVTDLTYPNGIMPWKGGIFVTCAPHIYYFKDTDNDGVADIKEIVLTGFNSDKTAQIRVSHPTLGLDGWVYVTSGLNSGKISSPLYPDRPAVSFTTADGRFNPETFEFQPTGGRSQFGLAFDPFGRRFGTSNRHPVMQMMIEPWQLQRNTALQFAETYQNVSAVEANAKVFPISGAVTTAEFIPSLMGKGHTGTFTSACGLLIYNGDGLTPSHVGNAFICEPAQNLVQRQTMQSKGVGFTSKLPYEGKEFLSSTDESFRPVFLQHGPDGALYVADMYRKVIDHPAYVPAESRHLLDFETGKSDGRIYRIYNEKQPLKVGHQRVTRFQSNHDLAEGLSSANEWKRQVAFRKILEAKDKSIAAELEILAISATIPETRTNALWLLHHLQRLDETILLKALNDKSGDVREQVVKIAGLSQEITAPVRDLLIKASTDKEVKVQFHTALALGNNLDDTSVKALAKIAGQNGDDMWVRSAVLSGIGNHLPEFLKAVQTQPNNKEIAYASVMQDLGQLFGNAGSVEECRQLMINTLNSKGQYNWRVATMLGLAEGISKRSEYRGQNVSPLEFLAGDYSKPLSTFISEVNKRAVISGLSVPERKNAVALLGYYQFDQGKNTLTKMMDNQQPADLQVEAVMALRRLNNQEGARLLTSEKIWKGYTPRVKSAAVAALVSNPVFISALFEAIDKENIQPAEISSTDRNKLLKNKEQTIADQAAKYFSVLESGGRMKVYEEKKALLKNSAVAENGKQVFVNYCTACHTYGSVPGGNAGPDLSGVRNQPAEAILLHVIVPNYEVYPAYQTLNIETSDGNTVSGWLLAETDNSITVRTAFSTEVSVLRKNIKSITNPGISLMPDGLEQAMTQQELLDMIAFLKSANQ